MAEQATAESSMNEEHDALSSDIATRLQRPLFHVESSPLHSVLNSFHARMELLTKLHSKDVGDVKQLIDELDERLLSKAYVVDEPPPSEPTQPVTIQVGHRSLLLVIKQLGATNNIAGDNAGGPRRRIGRVC